jgi:hypothetical protein
MKYSFPVTCNCGEIFQVPVTGSKFPRSAQCPKCESSIWLVAPLGNLVAMAILSRAATELLKNGDWTLTIVLSAMAIECDLAFLFMKWKRIDKDLPTDADQEGWENKWRDIRGIAAQLEAVSVLLTGKSFEAFVYQDIAWLTTIRANYPTFMSTASANILLLEELFRRRNKIVHFGKIDFEQPDAEVCFELATTLSKILAAMDTERNNALKLKHSIQAQAPSP